MDPTMARATKQQREYQRAQQLAEQGKHDDARSVYEVRHIYARYQPWDIGNVEQEPPYPSEVLSFDEASWNVPEIQRRFREAVARFGPDHVIITDSWNMKPVLAEAVRGYPYIL